MTGERRDITHDFLLCNRCGACRAVCPVYEILREEGASARGKVEIAEAFFRGEDVGEKQLQKVFDLCLHCMTCEENCPSGMRADEIIMAVRAEMAKRGLIPRMKMMALDMLRKMDSALFRGMRSLGLVRRQPLHGYGVRHPLRFLFPLFGWKGERYIPLPSEKPFLGSHPEFYPASDVELDLPEEIDLARRLLEARRRNLEKGIRAYFFVGHTVNHFFPEEAEAAIRVLNTVGVDVEVPADQECCGAPFYYAGDIESAGEAALIVLKRLRGHRYDWIVSTCSSGTMMLEKEFPRIFDLAGDGFFDIIWDPEQEVFTREPAGDPETDTGREAAELYRELVQGRVRDIDSLVADMLGLEEKTRAFDSLLVGGSQSAGKDPASTAEEDGDLPVVTYHHPCHLNRGLGVNWQPVAILELLPGYRYVEMPDADRCCGGGGAFTFTHAEASEQIASRKIDSIDSVSPDIVATSCPVCRIQLTDMMRRRFELEAAQRGDRPFAVPVKTPVELLDEQIRVMAEGENGQVKVD